MSSDDPRSILYKTFAWGLGGVITVEPRAPGDDTAVDYDRRHLALYAALLDAEDTGRPWKEAATSLMRIDVTDDEAEACWRSHLDRARWIVGDGLCSAINVFNERRFEIADK